MNRFGHDRRAPRLALARPIPSRLPWVISEAMRRAIAIYERPEQFPEFAFPGLSRQRRSERRETITLVFLAELLRTDVCTLRVGTLAADRVHLAGIPVAQIAQWGALTRSRVERALSDIARAGYQFTTTDKAGRRCAPQPRRDQVDPLSGDKTFRGLPAVRKFNPLFFRRLGLSVELERARKAASAARREEQRAAAEEAAAVARGLAREELSRLPRPGGAFQGPPVVTTDDRMAEVVARVWAEHRDWSADAIRAEAARIVRGTGPPE